MTTTHNANQSAAAIVSASPQSQPERPWTLPGHWFAELLRITRSSFLQACEQQRSKDYLRQSRCIIEEYATFCEGEDAANPWILRQKYLAGRASLRSSHRFSTSYLKNNTRELRYFLRWYLSQIALGAVSWGELSAENLRAYWSTQKGALSYRQSRLSRHLPSLLQWLQQRPVVPTSGEVELQLQAYFEERRLGIRGNGYGFVLTHRARIVTRRHLIWLEQRGHLAAGTATEARSAFSTGAATGARNGETATTQRGQNEAHDWFDHLALNVDPRLPHALRRPLIGYLEHLVHDRELVKGSLKPILRTNLELCRKLATTNCGSFAHLQVKHLNQVVASLVRASPHDLLRRRQQVQARNSQLRGFLRYLHREGLLNSDLATVLISPPCYGASPPPTVWSPQQVQLLLKSVDRQVSWGRRCYAILLLLTTYGLRPVDVSHLRLEDLHWRAQRIAWVQKKTGGVVILPLLPEVATALHDYLRHDRPTGPRDRRVFVSLVWPHRPVTARTICDIVIKAMRDAGMSWGRPKHLRASLATQLLRQGEAFSTIQEVLGHRTAETTQRYAVTDVELLRQVIEETER